MAPKGLSHNTDSPSTWYSLVLADIAVAVLTGRTRRAADPEMVLALLPDSSCLRAVWCIVRPGEGETWAPRVQSLLAEVKITRSGGGLNAHALKTHGLRDTCILLLI